MTLKKTIRQLTKNETYNRLEKFARSIRADDRDIFRETAPHVARENIFNENAMKALLAIHLHRNESNDTFRYNRYDPQEALCLTIAAKSFRKFL